MSKHAERTSFVKTLSGQWAKIAGGRGRSGSDCHCRRYISRLLSVEHRYTFHHPNLILRH